MRSIALTLTLLAAASATGSAAFAAAPAPLPAPVLSGRIIASGIPGIGSVSAVGVFHAGGPIHDNAEFAAFTARGRILDPDRILVTSSSNFGSPTMPGLAEGSVLSIDAGPGVLRVPAAFATAGGQASALDGRVQLFTAASAGFTNGVNSPATVTADLPSVSKPGGISINNAFGRLWFPSAPRPGGAGFESIVDPTGIPLANPPSKLAGGVFTDTKTNRNPQLVPGALRTSAIGNALLGPSSDGSKRAVFAILAEDGSIVQIHTEAGLDGLAPAGTLSPQPRAGMVFNWVPNRILYVTDAPRNAVTVIAIGDDGRVFTAGPPRRLTNPALVRPIDLAPVVAETANGGFSSNTTLAGNSDLYVLNGNGTIVRLRQDGTVAAVRRVSVPGVGVLGAGQLVGIAVSRDARHVWVTARGALGSEPAGAVIELPAFGASTAATGKPLALRDAGGVAFRRSFTPATGLGPLFNDRSCLGCHFTPTAGGMGKDGVAVAVRVAHVGEKFDEMQGRGGPVARIHSVSELGFPCAMQPGIPPGANVSSVRNAPALYNSAAMDDIDDATIAAGAVALPDGVHGRPNRVDDGDGVLRVGRFGWKADVARLETFVAVAFRNEIGVTNPRFPRDLMATQAPQAPCAGERRTPKDNGSLVRSVTAFVRALEAPPGSVRMADEAGSAAFGSVGCTACHGTRLRAAGEPLYSDLLLHDMGPSLDDGIIQGQANGRDWRTTPLLGTATRKRFLHDGRASNVVQAIFAHDGEGAAAVRKYRALDPAAQRALVTFVTNL